MHIASIEQPLKVTVKTKCASIAEPLKEAVKIKCALSKQPLERNYFLETLMH